MISSLLACKKTVQQTTFVLFWENSFLLASVQFYIENLAHFLVSPLGFIVYILCKLVVHFNKQRCVFFEACICPHAVSNRFASNSMTSIFSESLIIIQTPQETGNNKHLESDSFMSEASSRGASSPVVLHSLFQTFRVVHTNSFARLDGVKEQPRNSPHLLVRPSSHIPLPPQCSKTRQDNDRYTDQQIFWVRNHFVSTRQPAGLLEVER